MSSDMDAWAESIWGKGAKATPIPDDVARAVLGHMAQPGTHNVGAVKVSSPARGLVKLVLGSADILITSDEAVELAQAITRAARGDHNIKSGRKPRRR